MLYRVMLPYAVYGIVVESGFITKAAPIAEWSIGWSLGAFSIWIKRKSGTIERIDS